MLIFIVSTLLLGLVSAAVTFDSKFDIPSVDRAYVYPVIKRYTFGSLTAEDILAQSRGQYQSFWDPTDVVQKIRYSGVSHLIVTQAVVSCEQIGNEGSARITYGGIGQEFVEITVEAKQTTRLNCSWKIFARQR